MRLVGVCNGVTSRTWTDSGEDELCGVCNGVTSRTWTDSWEDELSGDL